MSSIKVELDREFFPKAIRQLQAEFVSMLEEIASAQQTAIRKNLLAGNIKNTGNLINSYQRQVSVSGNKGVAVVGSNALYALPVELGIKKKFYPPQSMIEAMKGWVAKKLGITGKKGEQVARAISWKIARKPGFRAGFPYGAVERAFAETSARVAFVIERHIKRAFGLVERFQ